MTRALLVVDCQNDFCAGGELAVPNGEKVIPRINDLATRYTHVVLTQDWHPRDHLSFHDQWGLMAFSIRAGKVMWPVHCVQGTKGAELSPYLVVPHARAIIRKGCDKQADSYSAFADDDGRTTGLNGLLHSWGVGEVDVVGLALDFCVAATAKDARKLGYYTRVLKDYCAAIDREHSLADAVVAMHKEGVRIE